MPIAFLNGDFLPLEDARISVLDRGFLFGDGVYEVIPVYGRRLFRLEHHLQRLRNSLDGVRIRNPMTDERWAGILNELVARNAGDQNVYLQVTRGVAPKRDHAFPAAVEPTVFCMCTPMMVQRAALDTAGVRAVTLDDIRWQLCDIKAITLLPNVLLRQQALDAGAVEAILITNGYAFEGAASNLFIVKNGVVITPPNGNALLPGITRDLILELAASHGIPCREDNIPHDDLYTSDEIWLTSSTREISPVTQLNNTAIGNGSPGPMWRKMIEIYREYADAVRRGEVD